MHYFSTKLHTKDLNEALRFYRDILGLQQTSPCNGGELISEYILLSESSQTCLYFETQDLDHLIQRLEAKQIPLTSRTTSIGQQIITLSDPMGNRLEIGEAMEIVTKRLLTSL